MCPQTTGGEEDTKMFGEHFYTSQRGLKTADTHQVNRKQTFYLPSAEILARIFDHVRMEKSKTDMNADDTYST